MTEPASEIKPAHVIVREARDRRANGGPKIAKVPLPTVANETREPDPLWDDVDKAARDGAEPTEIAARAHALLTQREDAIRADRVARARAKFAEAVARRARAGTALELDVPALAEIRALAAAVDVARVEELFPPLPSADDDAACLPPEEPMPWLVKGLELARGRPTLVVGYAGAAKSVVMLAAARDMALGRPLWGAVDLRPVRPLRVLYLDLDLGQMLTRSRLRRLLASLGADVASELAAARADRAALLGVPDDGRPMLQVGYRVNHEDLILRAVERQEIDRFRAAWTRAVSGYDVVIVDTLFATEPSVNENATESALPMILWAEVSERTGCGFLVLRHDGKPPAGGVRAAQHKGRGSSAIDGAAMAKFILEVENPDDPAIEARRKMTHAIARTGATRESFYLDVRGIEPAPLEVSYRSAQQVQAAVEAEASGKADPLDAKILSALVAMARRGAFPSATELRAMVGGRAERTGARITVLLGRGVLVHEGRKVRINPDAAPCDRCSGTGAHGGGSCFRCGGSAVDPAP